MDTIIESLNDLYIGGELFGNTLREYLIALIAILGFLIFFQILKNRIFVRLEKWAKKTKTDIDDEIIGIFESIPWALYLFVSIYIGLQFLSVNGLGEKIVEIILIILVIYWATKAIGELIEYLLYKFAKGEKTEKREKNTTYFALALIAKIILWSVGLLLVLSNLGVNISALIASLGIGGIAIALAVQNILSDIFSSFSLYLDKPFEVGDFIIVGENMGTVQKIGLKTTRIKALQGEEIVISNNELTSTRVRNYKKMKKRRIVFEFGVEYSTPRTKLVKIPKMVKEILKGMKLITLDRVHFKSFGDSSLNYEVVYYIDSGDYTTYMDKQQKINLDLVKVFEKEKIDFAFPTRTIHLIKEGES